MKVKDFTSITVTRGQHTVDIHNPTRYPLIGQGSHSAVFKIAEDRCVNIYVDSAQVQRELDTLQAYEYLTFLPKVYQSGTNYIITEYFKGPTLQEYLDGSMYMPESITKKLVNLLWQSAKTTEIVLDCPLHRIFIIENELKVIHPIYSSPNNYPVPLKLLNDLNVMQLKDSFMEQVQQLAPNAYDRWSTYLNQPIDLTELIVSTEMNESGKKVDDLLSQRLIGQGSQGVVYRLSEDKCVKVYETIQHAWQEKEVLLAFQDLSFIPKIFQADHNYIVMEYLTGPDLNTYLKQQNRLSEDITKRLLDILVTMKHSGFKLIDAPLRHIIITGTGFKLVDHVFSFSREQNIPLELFKNLQERNFLDSFLKQVRKIDFNTYAEWTKTPIAYNKKETI